MGSIVGTYGRIRGENRIIEKSDNIGMESSENGGKTLLLIDEKNTL